MLKFTKNNIINVVKNRYPEALKMYNEYKKYNEKLHKENPKASWKYLFRLICAKQDVSELKKVPMPKGATTPSAPFFDWRESSANKRPGENTFLKVMSDYDIVSFDIYDTAIFRKLENPRDIFILMGIEMNCPNFKAIRIGAEEIARKKLYDECNSREVDLNDIYKVLEANYNIEKKWMDREIELELDLCEANPYFLSIYKKLIRSGKSVVFTSDMYLPQNIIENILHKCGYTGYKDLFLSNVLHLSKTDGTMWNYIVNVYGQGKRIFHVGDNYNADIKMAQQFGVKTTYYHAVRELAKPYREDFINNLGGSFFRAVVNNAIHCGNWKQSISYEHGFRVGGILTYGYCDFISKRAKATNADLILFCARDCEIIHKVYSKYFNDIDSKYIKISRYAILNVTIDRYLDDLLSRVFNKDLDNKERATMRELLNRAGLSYLIDVYSNEGYNPEEQLNIKNIEGIKNFVRKHLDVIIKNNNPQIDAAKKYFKDIVGDHKNILIVDVGWTGSCIYMLDYFLNQKCGLQCNVKGALLIGNNNDIVSTNVMNDKVDAYLISPVKNLDLLRAQFKKDKWQTEMNNQMLEYMFTSTDDSLLKYELNDGKVGFVYNKRIHLNDVDIREMHKGVLAFAEKFYSYSIKYKDKFAISPYVACGAFYKSLSSRDYCKLIYGRFAYDAGVANYAGSRLLTFADVFAPQKVKKDKNKKNILLVSHSFTVSGAPRSLLRIGKVLISAGYNVEVWSPYGGGISAEYERENISVRIVKYDQLNTDEIIKAIKKFDFAICNTILTNSYYEQLKKYIPTVWYIREATNVSDYCNDQKKPVMYHDLCKAEDLICVSDYAADALKQYNKKVRVLKNCIEDESNTAVPYQPYKDQKIRFIQLGSLEYRKGFDVIVDAYDKLPEVYKGHCEFYFAGQIVPAASAYADEVLARVRRNQNMHYLGVIKDQRKKTELISSMDVVIVASRDESCSLVALEGTMLAKPLIVTENVGAKYVVDEGKNGFIVETGNVEALMCALRYFVDNSGRLLEMGQYSRKVYLERANMQKYTEDIKALVGEYLGKKKGEKFKRFIYRIKDNGVGKKTKFKRLFRCLRTADAMEDFAKDVKDEYPALADDFRRKALKQREKEDAMHYNALIKRDSIIVSLTSYPARMDKLGVCLRSLLNQTFKPDKVVLWLAKSQFPNGQDDLPADVRDLCSRGLTIEWCNEDLKPHKKYFYAMQKYPESVIITVDDDMEYSPFLVAKLYESYLRHPHAVSCLRAHLIKFNENGTIKKYVDWGMEDNSYIDIPTFRLLPTGVSGVLYPPHCLPKEAFDIAKIKEVALMTDDLWLKVMCTANNYPAVLAEKQGPIHGIAGTQDSAISSFNYYYGNDENMKKCLDYCNEIFGDIVTERLKMRVSL